MSKRKPKLRDIDAARSSLPPGLYRCSDGSYCRVIGFDPGVEYPVRVVSTAEPWAGEVVDMTERAARKMVLVDDEPEWTEVGL